MAKHSQNPRGNLVQSAFHQTLGDEFTFQQDNNLKHIAVRVVCIGGREVRRRRIKLSVMELFNKNVIKTTTLN